jgi:DNA-directed RNA polymerase subunit E'/Rpb7
MDELFVPVKSETSVTIEPKDLNNRIDSKILQIIKSKVEGKCTKDGFVKEKSIKLLNRSLGHGQASTFNGFTVFHIEYSMEICNPLEGAIMEVQAININKMGILAGIPYQENSPLNIMLAKQHHVDNEIFDAINVDDIFKVRVVGKRYEYGDTQISIIAVLENVYSEFKQN